MAINKNSTGYTFAFSIIMVVLVGASLATTSLSLKEKQKSNASEKKMMDILGAVGIESNRSNAKEKFQEIVIERISFDYNGEHSIVKSDDIEDADDPFYIDVRKNYRSNKPTDASWTDAKDLRFPIYVCKVKDPDTNDSLILNVIPVVGSGLWGPIWGYVALKDDNQSIYGAKFDHKTETPGLGAEINGASFSNSFKQNKVLATKTEMVSDTLDTLTLEDEKKTVIDSLKTLNYDWLFNAFSLENYNGKVTDKGHAFFTIAKGGTNTKESDQVDGITGGTITSKGVEEMINRNLAIYSRYFDKEAK
ncbi:MAG: hypothetical protein CL823_04340 [Crocinitomicaceae bacterium]|nr:hypothetical protein [Crocinitomicaceae bacterium]